MNIQTSEHMKQLRLFENNQLTNSHIIHIFYVNKLLFDELKKLSICLLMKYKLKKKIKL